MMLLRDGNLMSVDRLPSAVWRWFCSLFRTFWFGVGSLFGCFYHVSTPPGFDQFIVPETSACDIDFAQVPFSLLPYGDIVSALGSFSGGLSVVLVSGAGEVRLIA